MSEKNKCPQCGEVTLENTIFCERCGARITPKGNHNPKIDNRQAEEQKSKGDREQIILFFVYSVLGVTGMIFLIVIMVLDINPDNIFTYLFNHHIGTGAWLCILFGEIFGLVGTIYGIRHAVEKNIYSILGIIIGLTTVLGIPIIFVVLG